MGRRSLTTVTTLGLACAVALTVGASASAVETARPTAPGLVTLSKSQFALLKQARPIIEKALANADKKIDWEMRVASDGKDGFATIPTISIGQNTDPATGATCYIVLDDTDCDVFVDGSSLVLSLDDALAILDDADGLPSAADVLTTAQQNAIRERADEQGSANPWLRFPQGSAVASYVGNRLLPTMIPGVLMKSGLPPVARRGTTTNVERFTASDGSTVYRFTQRMTATLNGKPTKTMRIGYSIDPDGSLNDVAIWFDKTYLGGVTYENGEPFAQPTGIIPAASLGFPGT